ncbi:MAG: alpha/beta hydrolase [Caldilineaceae bacterium]
MSDVQEGEATIVESASESTAVSAEFATADGVIYYELVQAADADGEERPTITLLHNFMSTGHTAWGPLLNKLAQRYRLLLPDLPGHGRSLGHPSGYHYGEMAEQLAALMTHVGAQNGHLIGCSAGGMIAQLLVQSGSITPQTLTLVSTTYSIAENVTGEGHALKPENFRAGRRWMEATAALHDPYRYPGYYESVMLAGFRQLNPNRAINLPLTALAQWSMPVCIIHGTEDEFFPVTIAQQMAETIPNAVLQLVPSQPHALLFRQPWRVLRLFEEFLAKNETSG